MIRIKNRCFYSPSVLLFLIAIIAWSCGTKNGISVNEYVSWFGKKDCPVKKTIEVEGYQYELRYLTADCMALKDLSKEELSKRKLKEELKAREGLFYFLLRVTPVEEKKQKFVEEESKSISWLSFKSKEDIKVIQGADTLSCVMDLFEPSLGIMPYQSFNIGILKPENKKEENPDTDITLTFMDRVNSGKQIVFTIKASDFKQIPTYKL